MKRGLIIHPKVERTIELEKDDVYGYKFGLPT